MRMPNLKKDKRLGGLTALIIGYNDITETIILQIYYGKNLGNAEYIEMPYEYFEDINLVPEIYCVEIQKN